MIRQRSSWPTFLAVTALFGSPTAVTVWVLLHPRPGRHVPIGAIAVLGLILIAFWYGVLMITLKSVTLIVTPTDIVSRTASLPPRAYVRMRVGELQCIYVKRVRLHYSGSGSIYSLVAKRMDGVEASLVTESDCATAIALGRLIQNYVVPLEVRLDTAE